MSTPTAPRLKIQIVHPASKLELPDKLLIDRTLYWPFCFDEDKMPLNVREASDASGVANVTLGSRASMLGPELVTGQLLLKDLGSGSSKKFN